MIAIKQQTRQQAYITYLGLSAHLLLAGYRRNYHQLGGVPRFALWLPVLTHPLGPLQQTKTQG